jgi:hypothetical protein
MNTATCPDHKIESTDFVSLNAAEQPVFRCNVSKPPIGAHYFTVSESQLAKPAVKRPRKVKP